MNNADKKPNKALIALIVVVLIVLIGGGVYYVTEMRNESSESSQTAVSDESTSDQSDAESETPGEYTNGTYTATGMYRSPGGQEEIEVEVVLNDGKISDASVTSLATNPTSKQYQGQFIGGFTSQVVGKSINEVELDVVAGSSLTSTGFNAALDKIKDDATA